jgi:excisionase family DNA binding protein
MKIAEAAKALGVTYDAVYRLVLVGKLEAVKEDRIWNVNEAAVIKRLNKKGGPVNEGSIESDSRGTEGVSSTDESAAATTDSD